MGVNLPLEERVAQSETLADADSVYDRTESISLTDVFDKEFVQAHTEFESFDKLVAASPTDADSGSELGTVGNREWDEFVAETTTFETEFDLVMAARDHWVAKKLELT